MVPLHVFPSNIIILGSDTDIWVYGMAFMGCGWLGNKTVYVERAIGSECQLKCLI